MESQIAISTATARKDRKNRFKTGFSQLLLEQRSATILPPTNVKSSFEEIRVFVFDFDQTLTPFHLFHQLHEKLSVEELAQSPYAHPEFNMAVSELFRFLREKGKTIYIASRNYEDVIFYYIRQNIDPEFPIENIYADRGTFFSKDKWTGKGKARVFLDNAHRLHELLYIDDTFSDIEEFAKAYPELQHHHKNYFEPLSIDKILKIFEPTTTEEHREFTRIELSPEQVLGTAFGN